MTSVASAALPAELMDRLSAMQLVSPTARASRGVGEKPSRASGPGMEFAEFRAYRAGDDLRHVDARSLALGAPLTRTFVQRRQLLATIILDLTPSMASAPDSKAKLATSLASAIGYTALAGQDRVQMIVLEDNGVIRRSPVWQGRSRAPEVFAFAQAQANPRRERDDHVIRPAASSFADAVTSLLPSCDSGTIVFALSDFWETGAGETLGKLAQSPASIVAVQILSALERDPDALGEGVHKMVDAETGLERDIALDATVMRHYREALDAHCEMLSQAVSTRNIFLSVAADHSLKALCLEMLPAAGVFA